VCGNDRQVLMLIISVVSYALAGVIVYSLYRENLTVGLSSYLSIICTVLVGLTVANVIIEEAIITDIALVSLFLAFFARVTITEALSTSGLESLYVHCRRPLDQKQSMRADVRVRWRVCVCVCGSDGEPFLTSLIGMTTFNNVNHLLSVDFLISSVIAMITLISLPFPLPLDDDSWLLSIDKVRTALDTRQASHTGVRLTHACNVWCSRATSMPTTPTSAFDQTCLPRAPS
jgi:hypothetical protein